MRETRSPSDHLIETSDDTTTWVTLVYHTLPGFLSHINDGIINPCFKMLNFRMICYTEMDD